MSIRSTLTGTALGLRRDPAVAGHLDRLPLPKLGHGEFCHSSPGDGGFGLLPGPNDMATYDSTNYYKVGYNSTNPYGYGMYYPDINSTGQTTSDMACKIIFQQIEAGSFLEALKEQ